MPDPTSTSPLTDPARLTALRAVLASPHHTDPCFGGIARLAARSLGAPVAQLNFVTDVEQRSVAWTAAAGMEVPEHVPLEFSYCQHVVGTATSLVVPDTREHPLLARSPSTTELGVASYLGAPIVVSGDLVLGALCVLDFTPRAWTAEEVTLLECLAGFAVREIEARGHTETALRSAASILDSTEDAVFGIDLHGTVTSWNPGAERMLGLGAREVVGQPVQRVIPAELRTEFDDALRRIRRGEPVPSTDTTWLARERSAVQVSRVLTPVRDIGGRVVGATALLRDVTERVEADRARRLSEARFRALVEHGTELITVVSPAGVIMYQSPAGERLLGYTAQERAGRSFMEMVHPEDRERVQESFARSLQDSTVSTVECRVRRRDGAYRVLSSTGVSLLDEPAVQGIVVNSRDVTELREGEDRLRHAQKLEAVGRLAGGIAHDFNNVLTSITATAQLLLLDLPEGSPWRDDVQEIDRSAGRAAALTRQLLSFSRQQVLQPEILDLNSVAVDAAQMLRRTMGGHVELVTRLDAELGSVEADRGQVEQVLMNLVVNARDAMPDGGTVTVETRNEERQRALAGRLGDEVPPGSYVLLRVSDTGAGMTREVQERMFEPFFTTKPRHEGTGLGLPTVYGIVKQSGGFVQVETEEGRGTAVTIHLPRRGEGR